MWQVLYSDENVPMIIVDFDTMQIKRIQDFDNTINKKRKRNHDDDNNNESPNTQNFKINEDQKNEKSDSIFYNNDTEDDDDSEDDDNDIKNNDTKNEDTEDDDDDNDIGQDMQYSTSTSSTKKCNHYIKNHILTSHQNEFEAACEYMRNKRKNKIRGAIPKWVKKFELNM